MKRLLAAAAVLATLTNTALAGELTLFADSNFRGNRVTLERDARNLGDMNFNDRVSSIAIRSGVWQLCEHANFDGRCIELGPGEYRNLPDFNDAISSVREVTRGPGRGPGGPGRWDDRDERGDHGDWRGDRGGWRDDRRGGDDVELFSSQRFEGAQVGLSRDQRSLSDVGFNDRAGSIIIREGRWEFCEHADFRGQCVVFGPGRYAFLEQMNNRISSMRRVR
ncbi:beta/gamma crystallin-related protein [uncultured Massilia sp.]|uniref:beta/gamma crystallin-related protein n=1 Tax=uncultured Massilia sp. TaxID=169973 RepID=UPI0025F9951B|nr:beta/gamma crystallin-related protein [uncultured Massilia sp.]